MGPRTPRITAADAIRALQRDGWVIVRQAGSHAHLMHPSRPGRITVARHSRLILKPKTLERILEQAHMTVERLRELL